MSELLKNAIILINIGELFNDMLNRGFKEYRTKMSSLHFVMRNRRLVNNIGGQDGQL